MQDRVKNAQSIAQLQQKIDDTRREVKQVEEDQWVADQFSGQLLNTLDEFTTSLQGTQLAYMAQDFLSQAQCSVNQLNVDLDEKRYELKKQIGKLEDQEYEARLEWARNRQQ